MTRAGGMADGGSGAGGRPSSRLPHHQPGPRPHRHPRTAPPPTSTTSTTNPYAVPPVIDAAYVNRVLAGLDAALGDVTRIVLRTRTIPPEAFDRLRALYGDNKALQLSINGFEGDVRRNFANYKEAPGNRRSVATEIITGRPACIFARVERDISAVAVDPKATNPQWVGLKTLDRSLDPKNYNPTPWSFVYDGYPSNQLPPPDPCT